MNLFILDQDPVTAARYYQDLHVNKIVCEGSQILAAAYPLERLARDDCPRTQKGTPRVHGFKNHPMSKWGRENINNFKWTLTHILELSKEFTYRFDERHFTQDFIDWCYQNSPDLPDKPKTLQPQCFVTYYPHCIVENNPVLGYHNYYNEAKASFMFGGVEKKAKWTRREVPYFFKSK